MHLLTVHLAVVHGTGCLGELVADPARLLEHLCLHRSEARQRVVRALFRYARGHRRFRDVRRPAKGALDETGVTLLLEVGVRSEPGLECLAAVAAMQVENNHKVTASGMGRRCLSAGMRPRTSEIRLRSTSAKPTPGVSPMSSSTSPQGSTTSE